MNTIRTLPLLTALTSGVFASVLLAVPAWAQDPTPVVPPPGALGKPPIPTLKPGALPGKLPPDGKLGPLAQKGKGSPAGGPAVAQPTPRDTSGRRPPPGAARTPEREPARWQQVDDRSEEPTLSADFVKNCARLRPGVKVHLDIYDEEIEAVVKLIACMTGKNIILPKPLKGKKITIYSPTMVTSDEAYRVFLTALEANDLTIVEEGRFLKVIDANQASKEGTIYKGDRRLPNEDRMVTQIIPLENVDAQEMAELLRQFSSANANFVVYQPTNSLIVTETASNLNRLRGLLKELDIPGGQEQLWTYQVLHAEASDIAAKILELFEQEAAARGGRAAQRAQPAAARRPAAGKAAAQPATGGAASATAVGESALDARVSKVIADERTNRLLIVATSKSYRKIKSLIQRLDVAIPGDGQIHIHQLNHAKAADLASVLSNLSADRGRAAGGAQGRRQPARAGQAGARGAAAGAAGAAGTGGGTSAALFEGQVEVTADDDTNSLVVVASLKDYLSLKQVVDVLDRPRRQVFIEAVIMEVSVTNNRSFGVSMHGGTEVTIAGEQVPIVLSSQNLSASTFDVRTAAALQGLAVASTGTGTGINFGGVELPSFGVILNALARSSDVNILSTPHILTTDNEEAEIVVGSNVPFPSGIVGGLGALGAAAGANANALGAGFFPTVNVQRQDVALTLKITPRINAENFVTLEIDQVVEEIESIDQQLGPTTSKRSIKSTVIVKDQNSVVIGGLQRNRQVNNKRAVPFLGEIPLIGYFFRSADNDRERRNLLLLLTPYVVEGPADFRAIFERKLEEHREFVERFHQDGETLVLGLDYGKKHGVVEAMRQSLATAREEDQLLEELRRQEQGPPLPQDTDGIEIETPMIEVAPPPPTGGGLGVAPDDEEDGPPIDGSALQPDEPPAPEDAP